MHAVKVSGIWSELWRFSNSLHSSDFVLPSFRPCKKKELVSVLFSEILWSEGGFFIFIIFYFQAEVLMLKYNKTYHYLLSFLHPSVQAYCITHIKHHIGMQKTKIFGQLIQKSTKFCRRKIVLKHFKRKTMKIKKY